MSNEITGWMYLHTNGQLIYKLELDGSTAADIRESPFARCMWAMVCGDREGGWNILVEGLALGADKSRVMELAAKWGCDDADADIYAARMGIRLERDGNMWGAVGPGFQNLQESPAGFGETKLEAMAELAKDLKITDGTMWRGTFKDALAKLAAVPA